MNDFLALTSTLVPTHLHGQSSGITVRALTIEEQVAIEDRYFSELGQQFHLSAGTTAVSVSSTLLRNTSLNEFRVAIEFAFGLLVQSGFQQFSICASFAGSACLAVNVLPRFAVESTVFNASVGGQAVCEWIAAVMKARQKIKDRMHVTADRFVRYARAGTHTDALLDLCISLESLIGEKTEVAFRFSMCLAKIEGGSQITKVSELLGLLYALRSEVVHGSDPSKSHKKLLPEIGLLHFAAKAVLTKYVLFLVENEHEAWKKHLKVSLLN